MATKPDGTKIPVVDGKFSFLVQPNEEDIKNGIPGDHTRCMLCLCCKRLYDSTLVWVTRTRAYVELKTKGGKPELQRFVLTDPARVVIKDFDSGVPVSPEAVIFAAPRRYESFEGEMEKYHKRQERQKTQSKQPKTKSKQAYIKGTKPRDHSINKLTFLRDPASGMFHFRKPNIAAK